MGVGLAEDKLTDPESEGVEDEGGVHGQGIRELSEGPGDGDARVVGLRGLEGVDDGGLPGLDVFGDGPVGQMQLDGCVAEGGEPGEFAGGLRFLEAGCVACLERFDGGGMEKVSVFSEGQKRRERIFAWMLVVVGWSRLVFDRF